MLPATATPSCPRQPGPLAALRVHGALGAGRTLVMGVLNVTPDSFSDGGAWPTPGDAVRHARALVAAGADVVDVGGESTRPGAGRVPVAEELGRVLPVVEELAASGVTVSVDTTRAPVAAAALAAGAAVVNDVSGGLADPEMVGLVAERGVPYVLMHWRGHSDVMGRAARYEDVVEDVRRELAGRVDAVLAAGVRREQLVLDPGLGFAKVAEHDWALLAGLGRLADLGLPLLVGASRKRFLGAVLAGEDGVPRPAGQRDDATAAVTTLAAAAGAWCVRVHDVRASADAVRVVARWRAAAAGAGAAGPGAAGAGAGAGG